MELEIHCVKLTNKTDQKGEILHVFSYLWNLDFKKLNDASVKQRFFWGGNQ
jgi:hypothetical protein